MINIIRIAKPYFPKIFTPLGNGLYVIDLIGADTVKDDNGVECSYSGILQIKPVRIDGIRFGLSYYHAVYSALECWAHPKTFYYDATNCRVYINICDSTEQIGYQTPTGMSKLELLIIDGYIDRVDYSREDGAYYEDIYHRPCIASIGDITEKRDRVFFDNISYTTASVEFFNHDGYFDGAQISNCVCYYYQLEEGRDFTDAILALVGVVSKPTITNTKVSFTIDDLRKSLDRNIDLGKISRTTFPYYSTDDPTEDEEERIFPVAIGCIEKYQPPCVDKGDTSNTYARYALCAAAGGHQMRGVSRVWLQMQDDISQNYDLIIPDTGETISNPEPLSDDSIYATVASVSYTIDPTKGLLLVPRDTVCTASINDNEVSYSWKDINVNFTGYFNKTSGESEDLCGVDLIRIGLEVFGGIAFASWNYDLTAFAAERIKSRQMTDSGWTYSVLIDSEKTIADYLKEVCSSAHVTYKNVGDGRYSVKVYQSESAGVIKYKISPNQLLDREDGIAIDTSEIISTAKVTYGPAGSDDNQKTYTDDSRETDIQLDLHVSKTSEFETILSNEAGAELKAAAMLDSALTPPSATKFTLWRDTENCTLSCHDTILAPADRKNTKATFNLTSVVLSPAKNTVTLTGNWIANVGYSNYTQGCVYGIRAYRANQYGTTQHTEED